MSRTRREYLDSNHDISQLSTAGDFWSTDSTASDLIQDGADSYQTIDLTSAGIGFGSITLGEGNSAQTFDQITLWLDGVISFGAVTPAQIAFMSHFNGNQSIDQFPGNYISAGYTDESNADPSYEIAFSLGLIDYQDNGPFAFANAIPVLRVSWGTGGSGAEPSDKQIIFTASDFTIADTNFDNRGAGYGLGHDWVDGSTQTIPVAVDYGSYVNGQGSNFDYVKGDFSGAGKASILWQDSSGDIDVWAPSGPGAGYTGLVGEYVGTVNSSWSVAGVGDFNQDGKADILWRNVNGGVDIWMSNEGGHYTGLTGQFVSAIDNSWSIAGVGDFNHDGKSDILWRNSNGAVDIWYLNPGAGYSGFTGQYIGTVDSSWSVAGVGDFKGDGSGDILWRNSNGALDIWFANSGAAGFTGQYISSVDSTWSVAGVGDFNGDGKADILWHNANGTTYLWLSNSGAGYMGFTGQYAGDLDTSWSIAGVGDFNGDAKADILWHNTNGSVDIWMSNPGNGYAGFTGQFIGQVGTNWTIVGGGPRPPTAMSVVSGIAAAASSADVSSTAAPDHDWSATYHAAGLDAHDVFSGLDLPAGAVDLAIAHAGLVDMVFG